MKKNKTLWTAGVVVVLGIATLVVVLVRGKNHTFEQDFQIEAAAIPGLVDKIYLADKENNKVLLTMVLFR